MEMKPGETVKKVSGTLSDPNKMGSVDRKWVLKQGERPWVETGQVILHTPDDDITVAVGRREESSGAFQGLLIAEPKGGREVCILYFRHPASDEVWIGAVLEEHKTLGGKHLCAVSARNTAKQSRDEVRDQCLAKKVGLELEDHKPVVLKGTMVNAELFFFLANAKKKEGIRFSALEILEPQELLTEPVQSATGSQVKFKEGSTVLGSDSEIVFMPWHQLAQKSADNMLLAGITRLMAYLSAGAATS